MLPKKGFQPNVREIVPMNGTSLHKASKIVYIVKFIVLKTQWSSHVIWAGLVPTFMKLDRKHKNVNTTYISAIYIGRNQNCMIYGEALVK